MKVARARLRAREQTNKKKTIFSKRWRSKVVEANRRRRSSSRAQPCRRPHQGAYYRALAAVIDRDSSTSLATCRHKSERAQAREEAPFAARQSLRQMRPLLMRRTNASSCTRRARNSISFSSVKIGVYKSLTNRKMRKSLCHKSADQKKS